MLQIHAIPAFDNNYFWLIQPDVLSPHCFIVDPGSAQVVENYLKHNDFQLEGILLTHHHHDHIDGATELADKYNVPVYGPKSPRIPQVTRPLSEGDSIPLGAVTARILEIPGHTLDHLAYLIDEDEQPSKLFSGDTLFGAGCGRLFDGTAPMLFSALQRISALPEDTLIYGGHEYTLANIRFALTIEPDNQELLARQKREFDKRQQGLPTLPTLLSIEKRTNPFLRCHLSSVRRSVEHILGNSLETDSDV